MLEHTDFYWEGRTVMSRELPADDVSEPSSKERANHASRYEDSDC